MRTYELSIILSPDLNEADLSQEITSITDLIKQYGGEVANTSLPKKIDLGYIIQKKKNGQMVIIDFSLNPEKVVSLKNALGLKETLFRYTIIVQKKQKISI